MQLYTKNGRPLQVSGDVVYSRSGAVVGRISGDRVYGPNGRYVGTIDGDRLVYRSTDSAGIGGSFSTSRVAGSASARVVGSAIWGEEPDIPD
jgi:hypothetical protein